MWAAIALAFGLAMDATAVAAARGFARRPREIIILPALFGLFQSGMAALGWGLGAWGGKYVVEFDHWIAATLLIGIGGKMLYEAWKGEDAHEQETGAWTYVVLAVATSIDAAAAGITLPLMSVSPLISIVLIGTITLACSVAGYLAGRAMGDRLGAKLEILGGLVLIGLGVRVLVEHL